MKRRVRSMWLDLSVWLDLIKRPRYRRLSRVQRARFRAIAKMGRRRERDGFFVAIVPSEWFDAACVSPHGLERLRAVEKSLADLNRDGRPLAIPCDENGEPLFRLEHRFPDRKFEVAL